MSLLEVRTKVIELSGRTDLVVDTTSYVNNGIDWYITQGQNYLDSLINTENSPGIFIGAVAAGDATFKFARCRALLDVWFIDTDGAKSFPRRMTYEDFIEAHPENVATADRAIPEDYAPNIIRSIDTPVTADDIKKGIIFNPPADQAYDIHIQGLWFATALSVDADENYWTQLYPDLLVWAALYKLEVSYRNTEGARDWVAAINESLFGLDKDMANQDSAGDSQMIG